MTGWRPRLATGLLVAVVVAVGLGIDVGGWALHLLARADPLVVALDPPPRRGQPVHVLVVVSDDRAGATTLGDRFGRLAGARADSIVLTRVGPGGVVVEGLPRDLRTGSREGDLVLAEVREVAGPAGLVAAARDVTGRSVHHYLELDLDGVAAVVEALGGLEVDLRHPVRDRVSGFSAGAGRSRLDGPAAVAWLRSRQPETRVDGTWVAQPPGDLGRMGRTQDALRRLLAAMAGADAVTRGRVALTLSRHARVDRTLPLGSGLALARWAATTDVVCATTLPTRPERSPAARTSTLGPPHPGALARRVVVAEPSSCGD